MSKKITIKDMIKFGLKHITKKNHINNSIINKNVLVKSLSTEEVPLPVTFEVLYYILIKSLSLLLF